MIYSITNLRICLWLMLLTQLWATVQGDHNDRPKPNILWMISDDLSPHFKHFVSQDHPLYGKMTNLESLQNEGVTFTQAHAAQATCGPSRASFLSGRFPNTLKIWNFDRFLSETHPDILTVPKYFKQIGYNVQTFGKVFHPHAVKMSDGQLKDVYQNIGHYDEAVKADHTNANTQCGNGFYCSINSEVATDARIVKAFEEWVTPLAGGILPVFGEPENGPQSGQDLKPWMAVIGFRRPHSSFAAPLEMYEKIDEGMLAKQLDRLNIQMPSVDTGPLDYPLSRYRCTKMEGKTAQMLDRSLPNDTITNPFLEIRNVDNLVSYPDALFNMRRAYLAALLWIDEIVGRTRAVLNSLSHDAAKNTIILFSSDHGLQNGEHGLWCKSTLYETATRVAVVLTGQGIPQNKVHSSPFQLVDIFPTLAALVNGPQLEDNSGLPFDGLSFKPVFDAMLWEDANTNGLKSNSAIPATSSSTSSVSNSSTSTPATSTVAGTVTENTSEQISLVLMPTKVLNFAAYSVYPRCGSQNHPCTSAQGGSGFLESDCQRPKITFMGYAVRTHTHRYIEWRFFNELRNEGLDNCSPPSWPGIPIPLQNAVGSRYAKWLSSSSTDWEVPPFQQELYEYSGVIDGLNVEEENLAVSSVAVASSPEQQASGAYNMSLMASLSNMLELKFKLGLNPCSGRGLLNSTTTTCSCVSGWYGEDCESDDPQFGSLVRVPTPQRPTYSPSHRPTARPSKQPSKRPTKQPSKQPSTQPSKRPTVEQPSKYPSIDPSQAPSQSPSKDPTRDPNNVLRQRVPPTPGPSISSEFASLPLPPTHSPIAEVLPVKNRNATRTSDPATNDNETLTVDGDDDNSGTDSNGATTRNVKLARSLDWCAAVALVSVLIIAH